jgi:hypothetical protein
MTIALEAKADAFRRSSKTPHANQWHFPWANHLRERHAPITTWIAFHILKRNGLEFRL